jgi:hypothetical protein
MSLIRFTKACGGRVFLNDPPCRLAHGEIGPFGNPDQDRLVDGSGEDGSSRSLTTRHGHFVGGPANGLSRLILAIRRPTKRSRKLDIHRGVTLVRGGRLCAPRRGTVASRCCSRTDYQLHSVWVEVERGHHSDASRWKVRTAASNQHPEPLVA